MQCFKSSQMFCGNTKLFFKLFYAKYTEFILLPTWFASKANPVLFTDTADKIGSTDQLENFLLHHNEARDGSVAQPWSICPYI